MLQFNPTVKEKFTLGADGAEAERVEEVKWTGNAR
jgi:hypothetical protein